LQVMQAKFFRIVQFHASASNFDKDFAVTIPAYFLQLIRGSNG
jgi:hypothetical protein